MLPCGIAAESAICCIGASCKCSFNQSYLRDGTSFGRGSGCWSFVRAFRCQPVLLRWERHSTKVQILLRLPELDCVIESCYRLLSDIVHICQTIGERSDAAKSRVKYLLPSTHSSCENVWRWSCSEASWIHLIHNVTKQVVWLCCLV